MPLDKVFYILTADDQFDPETIEALRVLVERGEIDSNRQTRNRP